ncbi:hypothetical protein [Spongorhabdus nitratireducens]
MKICPNKNIFFFPFALFWLVLFLLVPNVRADELCGTCGAVMVAVDQSPAGGRLYCPQCDKDEYEHEKQQMESRHESTFFSMLAVSGLSETQITNLTVRFTGGENYLEIMREMKSVAPHILWTEEQELSMFHAATPPVLLSPTPTPQVEKVTSAVNDQAHHLKRKEVYSITASAHDIALLEKFSKCFHKRIEKVYPAFDHAMHEYQMDKLFSFSALPDDAEILAKGYLDNKDVRFLHFAIIVDDHLCPLTGTVIKLWAETQQVPGGIYFYVLGQKQPVLVTADSVWPFMKGFYDRLISASANYNRVVDVDLYVKFKKGAGDFQTRQQ